MEAVTIQQLIDDYQLEVESLGDPDDDDFLNASFAFITRDSLEDRKKELTQEEQAKVMEIDAQLRHKGSFMEDVLPKPLSTEENHKAGRWWYFINEYK